MKNRLTTIGFDADDTLWHNESFFRLTEDRFAALLEEYAAPEHLRERLLEAEIRNIKHYGYGVKGFTLSMIETAIEITEERVPVRILRSIVDMGRDMLDHPVELLPGAKEAITALSTEFRLVLITKGDLLHQEKSLPIRVWVISFMVLRSFRKKQLKPTFNPLLDMALAQKKR